MGSNALKFTKVGNVTISVEAKSTADNKVVLLFAVDDTGMDDYISKPVKQSDLERILLKWLPGKTFSNETMVMNLEVFAEFK